MQFSSGRPRRVSLDLTPLIDVVLMLVIFFMLTTTFVLSPGMKVDLPRSSSKPEAHEHDAIVIVTADGTLYYQNERVTLEALQAALRQRQQQQPGVRLIVKADTHAEHGWVVAIMDIAKMIGIDRLAIATAPKETQQ